MYCEIIFIELHKIYSKKDSVSDFIRNIAPRFEGKI